MFSTVFLVLLIYSNFASYLGAAKININVQNENNRIEKRSVTALNEDVILKPTAVPVSSTPENKGNVGPVVATTASAVVSTNAATLVDEKTSTDNVKLKQTVAETHDIHDIHEVEPTKGTTITNNAVEITAPTTEKLATATLNALTSSSTSTATTATTTATNSLNNAADISSTTSASTTSSTSSSTTTTTPLTTTSSTTTGTPKTPIVKLKEAEEELKEKVAEIEADPVILTARI